MTATIYRSGTAAAEVETRYREVLDRWPVPKEELYLSTCQGRTFVLACGPKEAPPILLLHGAQQEETEAKRMAAAEIIRSLLREIVLTPENGELQIDVRGDLAGILAISLKTERRAGKADCVQNKRAAPASFDQAMHARKKAAWLGQLMCAIWHRKLRWLRGPATVSTCSSEPQPDYAEKSVEHKRTARGAPGCSA